MKLLFRWLLSPLAFVMLPLSGVLAVIAFYTLCFLWASWSTVHFVYRGKRLTEQEYGRYIAEWWARNMLGGTR